MYVAQSHVSLKKGETATKPTPLPHLNLITLKLGRKNHAYPYKLRIQVTHYMDIHIIIVWSQKYYEDVIQSTPSPLSEIFKRMVCSQQAFTSNSQKRPSLTQISSQSDTTWEWWCFISRGNSYLDVAEVWVIGSDPCVKNRHSHFGPRKPFCPQLLCLEQRSDLRLGHLSPPHWPRPESQVRWSILVKGIWRHDC